MLLCRCSTGLADGCAELHANADVECTMHNAGERERERWDALNTTGAVQCSEGRGIRRRRRVSAVRY